MHRLSYLMLITLLGFSLTACTMGLTPPPVAAETTNATTPATEAPVADTGTTGACANPLLPIKVGATWDYKLTGTISDTFTRSILAVDGSGFTDQDVFGTGVTRQGKWNCDNGN